MGRQPRSRPTQQPLRATSRPAWQREQHRLARSHASGHLRRCHRQRRSATTERRPALRGPE
eukprot:11275956-Alexandrium_andersonii.AAC.1